MTLEDLFAFVGGRSYSTSRTLSGAEVPRLTIYRDESVQPTIEEGMNRVWPESTPAAAV